MFSFPRIRLFRGQAKSSPQNRHQGDGKGRSQFRPRLEYLEDRTLPSALPFWFRQPPPPGPATHLQVIAPIVAQVGAPAPLAVIALDASNHVDFNYVGTVHFTSGDGAATLPADYTFTKYDHGSHVFRVTFGTAGSQSTTATDTAASSITGSALTTVNPAPVATHFLVVAAGRAITGTPSSFTVYALDASNHLVSGYAGTVHITSSDTAATLPDDYTFVAGDHGRHTFSITYKTAGSQSVTATDTVNSSVTGSATTNVFAPGAAVQFVVFAFPRSFTGGGATTVIVVALDALNHIATGYTGTVHITSSDSSATLPADMTLTNGIGVFSVTLATAGTQTITATDDGTPPLTGSVKVRVR